MCLSTPLSQTSFFFFFNDTATTEIYTLSLHDALPIYPVAARVLRNTMAQRALGANDERTVALRGIRSEEHTSELQSQSNLVCRLLLEKKKTSHNHDHDVADDDPIACDLALDTVSTYAL